jgi:hypothetical protein
LQHSLVAPLADQVLGRVRAPPDVADVDVLITDPTAPEAALAELRALDRPRIVVA